MAQISENINFSDQNIHSYDRTRKMIVSLSIKRCKNKNNSTCQLRSLQNYLLMSIVDTPEKYLSDFDSEIRHEKSMYIFSKVFINIVLLLNT